MQETGEIKKTWTALPLLTWASDYLQAKGFQNPRLTIELLLTHVLRCKRIDLYTDFDKPLSQSELAQFKAVLKRRLAHEPLQYIIGETDFFGLSFVVDRRVLIPRPETEVLVEHAIELSRNFASQPSITLLDIGTGCGNIAVSIAKCIKNVTVSAIDVSRDALEVARINVERHAVGDRVRLLHQNIFASIDDLPGSPFDIIVSNPPYISKEEAKTLPPEILQFEPQLAVIEGGDGLSFFSRIADIGRQLLKKGGWVLVETAYNQGREVQSIYSKTGYSNMHMVQDYDGNNRVLAAQLI